MKKRRDVDKGLLVENVLKYNGIKVGNDKSTITKPLIYIVGHTNGLTVLPSEMEHIDQKLGHIKIENRKPGIMVDKTKKIQFVGNVQKRNVLKSMQERNKVKK